MTNLEAAKGDVDCWVLGGVLGIPLHGAAVEGVEEWDDGVIAPHHHCILIRQGPRTIVKCDQALLYLPAIQLILEIHPEHRKADSVTLSSLIQHVQMARHFYLRVFLSQVGVPLHIHLFSFKLHIPRCARHCNTDIFVHRYFISTMFIQTSNTKVCKIMQH